MNPLEKFERAIGKVLRPGLGQPGQNREPIEIRREVLREIADQVQPAGNGDYVFPFTGLKVELFAADAAALGALEALFALPGFAEDLKTAVADRGAMASVLAVAVEASLTDAPATPYRIAYQRAAAPVAKIAAARPAARLIVLEGQAELKELPIDRNLIYIGRLKEVVNSRTGLERQNQLAFDASESTVSRKHARVEYDTDSGKFRLFNDPERTSISRDGRPIACEATRGVQLRSGDEIVLGKARIRFEITSV